MKIGKELSRIQVVLLTFLLVIPIFNSSADSTRASRYKVADLIINRLSKLGFSGTTAIYPDEFIVLLEGGGGANQEPTSSRAPEGALSQSGGDSPSSTIALVDYLLGSSTVMLFSSGSSYQQFHILCSGLECPNRQISFQNGQGINSTMALSQGVLQTSALISGRTTLTIVDSVGAPISLNSNSSLGYCGTKDTPMMNIGSQPTNFTVFDYLMNALMSGNTALISAISNPQSYVGAVFSVLASSISVGQHLPNILKSALDGVVVCSFVEYSQLGSTEYVVLLQASNPTTTAVTALIPKPATQLTSLFAFPAAYQQGLAQMLVTFFRYDVSSVFKEILLASPVSVVSITNLTSFVEVNSEGRFQLEPNTTALAAATYQMTTSSDQLVPGSFQVNSATSSETQVASSSSPFSANARMSSVTNSFERPKTIFTGVSELSVAISYLPGAAFLNNVFRVTAIGRVASGMTQVVLGLIFGPSLAVTTADPVDAQALRQHFFVETKEAI